MLPLGTAAIVIRITHKVAGVNQIVQAIHADFKTETDTIRYDCGGRCSNVKPYPDTSSRDHHDDYCHPRDLKSTPFEKLPLVPRLDNRASFCVGIVSVVSKHLRQYIWGDVALFVGYYIES